MPDEFKDYILRTKAQIQSVNALYAAINAGRQFSFYFAGFPNPRQSPYTFGSPMGAFARPWK